MAQGYSHLTVTGAATIKNVNPALLTKLNSLGQKLGVTIDIFSGYRAPAYSAAHGGFATDPHTRGEAVDANINGRPIGDVIPLATLSSYGLQGGNTPNFYQGKPDAEHVQMPNSGVDKAMMSPLLGGVTTPFPSSPAVVPTAPKTVAPKAVVAPKPSSAPPDFQALLASLTKQANVPVPQIAKPIFDTVPQLTLPTTTPLAPITTTPIAPSAAPQLPGWVGAPTAGPDPAALQQTLANFAQNATSFK